jgi:hypothetical protein
MPVAIVVVQESNEAEIDEDSELQWPIAETTAFQMHSWVFVPTEVVVPVLAAPVEPVQLHQQLQSLAAKVLPNLVS